MHTEHPLTLEGFQRSLGVPSEVHGTPSDKMLAFFTQRYGIDDLRGIAGRIVLLHGHMLVWCVGVAEDDEDFFLIVEEAAGCHTRVWVSCVIGGPMPLTGLDPAVAHRIDEAFGRDEATPRPFLIVSHRASTPS